MRKRVEILSVLRILWYKPKFIKMFSNEACCLLFELKLRLLDQLYLEKLPL